MTLTAGSRLGVYEIQSLIGAGGMGEVYRARDARLQRDVAIKVLPAAFAADPERMMRFEQEARAAAALNHPNILAVHDLGQHAGAPFIVTELLDGMSLREALHGGALPARKAIEYGVQIAQGLAAAHDKGIVHRDLKPDNVFVGNDGRVKILDFGLAKLTQPEALNVGMSVLPTTPAFSAIPNTAAGMVLGTMGYMSPEQVRGGATDHRTDIFALGVVLYEMLAGRRAFAGDTAVDVMSGILKEDPPELPIAERHIPPALSRIVGRCLEKNSASRFQSARDLAFALEALSTSSGSTGAHQIADVVIRDRPVPRKPLLIAFGVAAVAVVMAAAIATVHFRERAPAVRTVRFQIAAPGPTGAEMLALSPDGQSLAFVAATDGPPQIWIRPMDAIEAKPLVGTDNATYPFWSPDGAYLGFFAQGKLKKVATAGGPPIALCDSPAGRGGSWNADGTIIFSSGPTSPIYRIAANGGSPVVVISLPSGDKSAGARYPSFLPDGDHFFYMATSSGTGNGISIGSLSGGMPVPLLKDPSNAVFANANGRGYVLFRREETLMAQQFDPAALTLAGDVIPVASPVPITENIGFGAFTTAADGTLVYSTAATSSRELAWFDRQGTRVTTITKPLQIESFPIALSPDEKRVAYSLKSGTLYELWVQDLSRDVATRFTFAPGIARNPVWSADGSMLYYAFFQPGAASAAIYRKRASGSGQEERLVESGVNGFITDLSKDGELALFSQTGPTTDFDIWLLRLTGDRKAIPYLQTPFGESDAVFAPVSGPVRWVAYDSNESGRSEVYLQQLPATGAKFQVSTSGGSFPAWRADGRELYYIENGTAFAVPVTLGSSVEIGTPKALFRNPVATSYAVSRDGQRVVLNVPAGGAATIPPVTAVLNWAAGLKH
jgi:eukaryotic-like serine/threonine-protein kinase